MIWRSVISFQTNVLHGVIGGTNLIFIIIFAQAKHFVTMSLVT